MKVALYARVSTEQQIENYSIPLQRERMIAYCKSKGWKEFEEYIDPGYSGSNLERPALQKLISNLDSINVVIVYKLDRLSRSQKDTLYLIEDCFLKRNVEFISLTEAIDTSSPFGRAMIGILSVFAQLERETITERLQSGRLKMTKELGYWSGGDNRHPTGYTRLARGQLVVNPDEAILVKRIFREYLTLQSITKIQKKFREEGLPVWRFNRIAQILKNRLYIGEVSFAGEAFKGSHEPLIDEDTFNQVQMIMSKHRGKNYGKIKETYLSQKIVCAQCGEIYTAYSTGSQKGRYKYRYYICRRRRFPSEYETKCYNMTWKKEVLEDHIFSLIENLTIKNIKKNKPIINYDKLINDIDKKLKKVLDLYVDGMIAKSQLDEKINELNKEKEELVIRKQNDKNNDNQKAIDFINQKINIREASNDEKLTIINLLIDKIYIDNDNLEVVWNF